MYTPHVITLFNTEEVDDRLVIYRTVLDGVFVDTAKSRNNGAYGVTGTDAATLYIPFDVKANNGRCGSGKEHLSPKSYHNINDKHNVWTIEDSGETSSVVCYICKGVVNENLSYKELKQKYDDVYAVTGVKTRDFGTADMQHWEVSLK